MLEIAQWIIAVGAGGIISVVTQLIFLKSNKRIKKAEADEKDITNINSVIASLKNQIEFLTKRVDILQEELGAREEKIRQKDAALALNELKYQQKKNCISQAYGCQYSDTCPVLARQKKFEEEYLKSLEYEKKE
ncbi:MAG: hypothetical protein LBK45_00430 [Tannerellaceae bacterium]|jgi:tRNA A37 threonylcarbamoyladenosine dehydratase|nr:hypothetical protein [Tannerellaceae bacterium]